MSEPDLAQMLRELADRGWKPVLYAEAQEWVCYPQAQVRWWISCRAPDPLGAARTLWEHVRVHPNEPPLLWRESPALPDQFGRDPLCEDALPPARKPLQQGPPPETSTAAARPPIEYGRSIFAGLFGGGRRGR